MSTTSLGCNALCMDISFLVLWSIFLSSSRVYLKKGSGYLPRDTVHVFIPLIKFLLDSFFNIFVVFISSFSPIRGTFYKIADFFVQVFKIVVDSWKFTMLLLYILWDGWLILMISGSNEQLQQQLEYTLLKRDCHSWRFSKMQSG